jgi:hypothetical protein
MNQGSDYGGLQTTSVVASADSFVRNEQLGSSTAQAPVSVTLGVRNSEYGVADVFGRFVLRVCYWLDMFSSLARRDGTFPHLRADNSGKFFGGR